MAGLAHAEEIVEMRAGGTHSEGWKETQEFDLVRLDPFAIGEPLLKRCLRRSITGADRGGVGISYLPD